jgi:hypothetical protein
MHFVVVDPLRQPLASKSDRCPVGTLHVMIRIGLTIVCLLRMYVSPLSLSAVSSHVVVLLLILGPV